MNISNYNYDRCIPDLIYPPTNFPNEPSTIDFLEINFSQRLVVDITINRANNPPKVVTISNGTYAIIKYVFNGVLYKVAGRIRDIQVKNNNDAENVNIRPTPMRSKTLGKPIFILEIDCSDRCESRVYNISSCDIRDIDIFDPRGVHKHHHHHHDIDITNPDDPSDTDDTNSDTDTGDESEDTKDVVVTPDTDLEDDSDFGTDEPTPEVTE